MRFQVGARLLVEALPEDLSFQAPQGEFKNFFLAGDVKARSEVADALSSSGGDADGTGSPGHDNPSLSHACHACK
jgi:hypothetical protein